MVLSLGPQGWRVPLAEGSDYCSFRVTGQLRFFLVLIHTNVFLIMESVVCMELA